MLLERCLVGAHLWLLKGTHRVYGGCEGGLGRGRARQTSAYPCTVVNPVPNPTLRAPATNAFRFSAGSWRTTPGAGSR